MTHEALAISVMKMARAHARHVSRLSVLQRVVVWFFGRTTRLAQRLLIAQARRMQDKAVWFAGATAMIDRMGPSDAITVDEALFDELRTVEAQLMQLRDEDHDGFGQVVRLYECVRDFRGAAQAYAANCCATYQARRQCRTGVPGNW